VREVVMCTEQLLLDVQFAVAVVVLDVRVVVAVRVGARKILVLRQSPPPLPVEQMGAGGLERGDVDAVPAARIRQRLTVGLVLGAEVDAQVMPALPVLRIQR
jgi:hypothetical protein